MQENGPEDLAAKRALYAQMEPGLDEDAVVASSTSGIMPSELQAGRQGEGRYLVAHPFNPPHLIPMVELVGGRATDSAAIDRAGGARRSRQGHDPGRREIPGHVVNRMQVALYREAINLVLAGVADLEDVDRGIAYGPGLRWAIMGPHATHHLAGGTGGLRHLLEHIGPGLAALDGRPQRPADHARGGRAPGRCLRGGSAALDRAPRGRARRAARGAARDPADHPPAARRSLGERGRGGRFAGKSVIVTGGAAGIGAASARLFAASVVIADLDPAGEALAAELCGQGREAAFIRADVADARDAESLVALAVRRYGRLDVLHNNAGVLVIGDVTRCPRPTGTAAWTPT